MGGVDGSKASAAGGDPVRSAARTGTGSRRRASQSQSVRWKWEKGGDWGGDGPVVCIAVSRNGTEPDAT